jgi:hypothetical protein
MTSPAELKTSQQHMQIDADGLRRVKALTGARFVRLRGRYGFPQSAA